MNADVIVWKASIDRQLQEFLESVRQDPEHFRSMGQDEIAVPKGQATNDK